MRNDCIHKIRNKTKDKNTFILLAANKMKIRGQKDSVSLLPLGRNECLIDKQVNIIYRNYPHAEIFLATGFDSQKVINYVTSKYKKVRIVENLDYKNTSSLYTLRSAINLTLESNVHIIHADRLFNSRAIIPRNQAKSYVYTHMSNKSNYFMGLCYQNKKLTNMSYGLPSVWSEIVYITKKDYEPFKSLINSIHEKRIYSIHEFVNYSSSAIEYFVDDDKKIKIDDLKEVRNEDFNLYS